MTRKRLIYLDENGTRELDRLVSKELYAVEKEMVRQSKPSSESWDDELADDRFQKDSAHDDFETAHSETETLKKAPVKPLSSEGKVRHSKVISMNKVKESLEGQGKIPEEWDDAGPELEVDLDYRNKVLFDREEEAFIDKAIEFLKHRDNKDIIISRIWNLLTEIEPDSFFSPEPEEAELSDDEDVDISKNKFESEDDSADFDNETMEEKE